MNTLQKISLGFLVISLAATSSLAAIFYYQSKVAPEKRITKSSAKELEEVSPKTNDNFKPFIGQVTEITKPFISVKSESGEIRKFTVVSNTTLTKLKITPSIADASSSSKRTIVNESMTLEEVLIGDTVVVISEIGSTAKRINILR